MVGGCGPISGSKIQAEFYHGHALISDVSHNNIMLLLPLLAIMHTQALYDRIMNTCDFEQSLLT